MVKKTHADENAENYISNEVTKVQNNRALHFKEHFKYL